MSDAPGQESGQFSWAEFVDRLVAERGSLSAVARHIAERRAYAEDVESVERGLRRLRARETRTGGVWGERVLRVCGLPADVDDRVRWMGQYHTRFSDLPVSLCAELLDGWDRPPVSDSPARTWVLLGRASVALRRAEPAGELLAQARLLRTRAPAAARVELDLVEAYALSRADDGSATQLLDDAEVALEHDDIAAHDRACLLARLIDQRAYRLNKPKSGAANPRSALELYETIPVDGPPFARVRRHNGIGWSLHALGDGVGALRHARLGVEVAGDLGSLRLRAMSLNLLARVSDGDEAASAAERAIDVARRLEDEALLLRFTRKARRTSTDQT